MVTVVSASTNDRDDHGDLLEWQAGFGGGYVIAAGATRHRSP
jgi:hypothetical protein